MANRVDALLLTEESGRFAQLKADLSALGIDCSVATYAEFAAEKSSNSEVDLLFVSINGGSMSYASILEDTDEKRAPVIALLSREALLKADALKNIDDFIVEPYNAAELAVRARRLIRNMHHAEGHELITYGDLVIDLNECEVYVDKRKIDLTFREYELLCFLASSPGRVFSRDVLLDKVWGYDYYGGDRTVDVHIRRLRSKIEDSGHVFIETLRNMGYRFKKET